MVSAAIDFKFLLLENYKRMKITEDELVTIFVIDHLLEQGNPFITADLLALKMSYDVKVIDKILASLLKKKLLDYDVSGKSPKTTLEPLKKKLYTEFQYSLTLEEQQDNDKEKSKAFNNVTKEYTKLFDKTLSPVESNRIKEWITFGYSEDAIINAFKDAIQQNKKTIRSVEKILQNYQIREDIEIEGHTSINKDWDRNLEETIKIAKTPWLKDNDK